MRRTIGQTRLRLAALRQRIEAADLLSLFTVLMVACSGAITTSLQIAEYRWEQTAKAAFYARMPALVVAEPLFNFVRREQLITATAVGIIGVVLWVIFTRWLLSAMHLANRQTLPHSSAAFDASAQLQAIRESLKRGADASQIPPWRAGSFQGDKLKITEYQPDHDLSDAGFEYVNSEYVDPAELHAAAEISFRLAAGPVSSRLAEELEALGQTLQREAEAAETVQSHEN